jgi:hypothetical protein
MSLSARHRQALSSIEDEFAASDPRLARLFDEFSLRMAGEKMPAAERGRAGWRRFISGPRRWLRRLTRPRHARPRHARQSWLPTTLVVSFLLIGTVVAALVVSHVGIHGACATVLPTQAQCAQHTPLPH